MRFSNFFKLFFKTFSSNYFYCNFPSPCLNRNSRFCKSTTVKEKNAFSLITRNDDPRMTKVQRMIFQVKYQNRFHKGINQSKVNYREKKFDMNNFLFLFQFFFQTSACNRNKINQRENNHSNFCFKMECN